MQGRAYGIAGLLLLTLASCASPPKAVAPLPATPAQPPCTAEIATTIAFKDLGSASVGKCVKLRGLSVDGVLYEDGAKYSLWWKRPIDRLPSLIVALLWSSGEPPPLKSHPQFIEVIGTLVSCAGGKACPLPAQTGIRIVSFKMLPTAMD